MENILIQFLDSGTAILIKMKGKYELTINNDSIRLTLPEEGFLTGKWKGDTAIESDGEYWGTMCLTLSSTITSKGFLELDCVEEIGRNRNGF